MIDNVHVTMYFVHKNSMCREFMIGYLSPSEHWKFGQWQGIAINQSEFHSLQTYVQFIFYSKRRVYCILYVHILY